MGIKKLEELGGTEEKWTAADTKKEQQIEMSPESVSSEVNEIKTKQETNLDRILDRARKIIDKLPENVQTSVRSKVFAILALGLLGTSMAAGVKAEVDQTLPEKDKTESPGDNLVEKLTNDFVNPDSSEPDNVEGGPDLETPSGIKYNPDFVIQAIIDEIKSGGEFNLKHLGEINQQQVDKYFDELPLGANEVFIGDVAADSETNEIGTSADKPLLGKGVVSRVWVDGEKLDEHRGAIYSPDADATFEFGGEIEEAWGFGATKEDATQDALKGWLINLDSEAAQTYTHKQIYGKTIDINGQSFRVQANGDKVAFRYSVADLVDREVDGDSKYSVVLNIERATVTTK